MSLSRSGSGSSFEEVSRPAEGWMDGPDGLTTPTEEDAAAGYKKLADGPVHPAANEGRLSRALTGDTDQEHLTDVFVPDTPAPAQQSRSASSPRANDPPELNKAAVGDAAPVVSDPDSEQLAHVEESEDDPAAPLPVPPPFMLTSAMEPATIACALIVLAMVGCIFVGFIGPTPMSMWMIILVLALATAPLLRLILDLTDDEHSFAKLPEYARPVYRVPKDQQTMHGLFLFVASAILLVAVAAAIVYGRDGRVHVAKGPSIAATVPMPHAHAANSTSIPSPAAAAAAAPADAWREHHASMAELRELMATQTATMQRQMDAALRALHAAVDPVRAGEASGAWGACEQETEWLACEQALQTADQQMETKEKLVSALTLRLGQCQGALDEMHRAQQAYAQAQAASNPPRAADANVSPQSQGSASRKPARPTRSTHAPDTHQDKPSKRNTADAAASGEHAMLWSVSTDAVRAAREQAAAVRTATVAWAQAAAQQSSGAVRSGWKAAADRLSQLHGGVVVPAAGRVQESVRAVLERHKAAQEAGRKRAEEVVAEVQARNAVLQERMREGVEGVMRAVHRRAEVNKEVVRESMEVVMRTVKEGAEAAHARVKKAKVATRVQLDPVASRVSRFAQWVGNKTESNPRVKAAKKATRAQLGRFAQWVGNKAGHAARSEGGNAKSKAGK